MSDSWVACPHCGGEIRSDADFCRHCGSSDADGWKEEDWNSDAEDDFDYDEFVRNELEPGPVATRVRPVWKLAAIVLLAIFVLSYCIFIF